MKRILILIIISILVYLVFAFQKNLTSRRSTTSASANVQSVDVISLTELEPALRDEITGVIPVIANKNSISPNSFQIPHFKSVILRITALDNDYLFSVKDFNITETVARGQTKDIIISGLGVGSFLLECGFGCTGTIIVNRQSDFDD